MKYARTAVAICLPLLGACASDAAWRSEDALLAELVEMQVDGSGNTVEIEYHVAISMVPAEVRAAMDALHPGGRTTGAEKEYQGSELYWEITKQVGGRSVEAMFRPDGTVHSQEIEVPATAVPEEVKRSVASMVRGQVTKWEEIRDEDGELVEYHAKVSSDGMKYKASVSADGEALGVVREIPAEIEVPVR